MRGRCSLTIERLQSDYGSCPAARLAAACSVRARPIGRLRHSSRDENSILERFIGDGARQRRYLDDFIIWRPVNVNMSCVIAR